MFTILHKKVRHESNIYKGAKMPHMQRLTWTGIAMHAGRLPGYPASHGCVRLPVDFARKALFRHAQRNERDHYRRQICTRGNRGTRAVAIG